MKKFRPELLHFGIILYILGMFLFLIGIHNVDISMNMFRIQNYTGMELIDIGFSGMEFDAEHGYITGMLLIIISLIFFTISFAILLSIIFRTCF